MACLFPGFRPPFPALFPRRLGYCLFLSAFSLQVSAAFLEARSLPAARTQVVLAQGQHVPGGQAERNVLNSRVGPPRVAVALERAQTSLWGLAAWFVPFSGAAPALELPWAARL